MIRRTSSPVGPVRSCIFPSRRRTWGNRPPAFPCFERKLSWKDPVKTMPAPCTVVGGRRRDIRAGRTGERSDAAIADRAESTLDRDLRRAVPGRDSGLVQIQSKKTGNRFAG